MDYHTDLIEILKNIDPSKLDYTSWINVGMALKYEGYSVSDWDDWSSRDVGRYHSGECSRKWNSFNGDGSLVTAGTIVQFAKDQGWIPSYASSKEDRELDWDDIIGEKDDYVVVDKHYLEGVEIEEPKNWNPVQDIIKYLETLFEASENVGYVVSTYEKDGKFIPSKAGSYDRTSGQLIELLSKCNGDIGAVLGDYKEASGAWIRFNPLDGKGAKDINITDYRYALVESDSVELEKQNAIIRQLELPVACLVYSGKKSIHAIVRVDAADMTEYRKRVSYLYDVCKKNGLEVDSQNRNPSRLSRMPGVMRNGKKQFLIDTNIGKGNWEEWYTWIEGVNDDLPEPESMSSVWDNLPELAPSLIEGILRQGHKMLMAGPSKAGKSYALIELCIAIAEGRRWLTWNCTQGRVLYVNLELDRASCLHRFKDVYTALGWPPSSLKNIDIWNLRGKSVPMDKLAPKLIRRASKKGYIAIVIDPIYKIITGDENSADQMAHFTNQFDKVCTELGSAVIYCHHHSKGYQGGKRSMDRASGSGVFARDPDALIDLVELELTESLIKHERNKMECQIYINALKVKKPDYYKNAVSQDDELSARAMREHIHEALTKNHIYELDAQLENIDAAITAKSAWRIEGTLREYPKFEPINLWFDYPVHKIDDTGTLKDIDPEGETPSWKKNFPKKKTAEERANEKNESLETAFQACSIDGDVTVKAMAEYMGVTEKTVRNNLKKHGGFWIDEGIIGEK